MQRIFVEKRPAFAAAARHLLLELRESLELPALENLRLVQRYDIDGLDDPELALTVLSEPPIDQVSTQLDTTAAEHPFAIEYLPGQFDQRADSAAQCLQILTGGERPRIAAAQVVIPRGPLDTDQLARLKDYLINRVDSHEASLAPPDTLEPEIHPPAPVPRLDHFNHGDPASLRAELGLAMSEADLAHCQRYFHDTEGRAPTLTEIRLLDTYWSDHCRHTTFHTRLEPVEFEPGSEPVERAWHAYLESRAKLGRDQRPVTLMEIALAAMRELRASGELDNLEESDEVNAASIIVPVEIQPDRKSDGESRRSEEWLIQFKNETHNHPTEIEPFGGAATCLGGCIRDPLSGRAYVYQAMRVSGAADPRAPFADTLPGKLPQRKICQVAARGYSSYGNQIGLATGEVAEIYHPGYLAKRLEIGAVVAAAPRSQVLRGTPAAGDLILLIGGRTGRDGIGGATGSSKQHGDDALENSAEVQKGDAPTERKIQRLFRRPELARRIKVCNDFGAGGVSVAIGEIAPSLDIDLDAVPRKYEGLDGTELAISESQERMAVCIDPADRDFFIAQADEENLECVPVARVADHGRLRMRWRDDLIVDLARDFLDTHGVQQSAAVRVAPAPPPAPPTPPASLVDHLASLDHASQKGLGEMFDASVGAATVLWPFGGERQLTPPDAMVATLPVLEGSTSHCSHMSWAFDPELASASPFHGAAWAVTESVAKLVASGARLEDARLTFQEYFPRLGDDPARWGQPLAALLGAFEAQQGLRLAAIGGKDSMSGSFNELDVPPTLVSFALAPGRAERVFSPEFKLGGTRVSLLEAPSTDEALPDYARFRESAAILHQLQREGHLLSAKAVGHAGLGHALAVCCFGNYLGFQALTDLGDLFAPRRGAFLVEHDHPLPEESGAVLLGRVLREPRIELGEATFDLDPLLEAWTGTLEPVYPTRPEDAPEDPGLDLEVSSQSPPRSHSRFRASAPEVRVLVPAFPGTNSEYDSARAFAELGAATHIEVFRNLTPRHLEDSLAALAREIRASQILFLPGGFSAGDEPDGSARFIAAVLRHPQVADAVLDLVHERDGLVLGICNGFQALIKTGLVPYGEFREPTPDSPTLFHNDLGRHVSRYVHTRVASRLSPWLAECEDGEIHHLPVSHGEGKFVAPADEIERLAAAGQIATQYCTPRGKPSMAVAHNPNGSLAAAEGLSSPCGRILGKMAHSERRGPHVAINIPGNKHQPLFQAGLAWFS